MDAVWTKIFEDKATRERCHILRMLETQPTHISFHTPGHKIGGWDITELAYSDNLSCPRGCIALAEQDIAQSVGAAKSFILTDGSTSGVLAMLYAAKSLGVEKIAVCESAHKSVYNGCKLLGLQPLVYPRATRGKIPFEPTMSALNEKYLAILEEADALLFTTPDYYGNCADLRGAREYCDKNKKLLLVDGAHGGHMKDDNRHARFYADIWVDGVHKSLPALTQGAVVSAAQGFEGALADGVDIFRTTSPSYPIMASVEYAVKYPENKELAVAVTQYKKAQLCRVYQNEDWTKLCVRFGEYAFEAEKKLQEMGLYPEFCDGNVVTFYLSPATKTQDFEMLKSALDGLYPSYPLLQDETQEDSVERIPAPLELAEKDTEWVDISAAENRICARTCGLFPPCTPLFSIGERATKEKLLLLQKADNVFGVKDGKICVYSQEK